MFFLQELQDILAECVGDGGLLQVREETCHWLNFIIAFIFNELRDSTILKRCVYVCAYVCVYVCVHVCVQPAEV